MTRRHWVLLAAALTIALAVLCETVPAVAHHSSAPFYDATKRVEATGMVTKFLFRNPHSFLYIEVADEQGQKIEWQIELGASASLVRTGWTTDALKPGTIVKVSGQPSRAEGSHGMCCVRLTRADGSPIVSGGRVTEEQQPPR